MLNYYTLQLPEQSSHNPRPAFIPRAPLLARPDPDRTTLITWIQIAQTLVNLKSQSIHALNLSQFASNQVLSSQALYISDQHPRKFLFFKRKLQHARQPITPSSFRIDIKQKIHLTTLHPIHTIWEEFLQRLTWDGGDTSVPSLRRTWPSTLFLHTPPSL